ncbi:MAG: hypothetical protein ACTSP4_02995 [Candidatus Hodarchaeales archaeon]
MAIISMGVTLIFAGLALTSLYISYLCRGSNIRLGKKIVDLQASLKERLEKGDHTEFTVSQAWFMKQVMTDSEDSAQNRFRDFFNNSKIGKFTLLSGVLVCSGLGIVIGVGLSLYNQDTAIQIGIFPLIVIITYVFIVLLSEVIATIKFSSDMSIVDCNKLGKKDLKVFQRASHILNARRKQYTIIAGLLVLYGLFSEIFSMIIIGLFAVIELLYIGILGNPLLKNYIVIVFLVGALFAVLVSILISKVYVAFLKLLMRIDFTEFEK